MGNQSCKPARHPLPNVTIRKSKRSDVGELAKNLREADCNEAHLFLGLDARQALDGMFSSLQPCYTIVAEGAPQVMFGAVRVKLNGRSIRLVACLSSPYIEEHPLDFTRYGREWLRYILEGDIGTNWISRDNVVHLKWIKILGGSIVDEVTRKNGAVFVRFEVDGSKI